MTYLVTGGTGLVGAYVSRDLARKGEPVVSFDIGANHALLQAIMSPEELAKVTVVRGDITDWPELLRTLQQHRVDTIVHLASLLRAGANANPPLAFKVMCQGTNNVFEGAALLGIRKVVWASSGSVFGPRSVGPDGVVHNDALLDPQEPYGACKALNEAMARHYIERYGLDLIAMRFSLVYGYGRGMSGAGTGATYMTELVEKPALGQGPCVVPTGDAIMDWLYVEDAARAVLLAAATEKPRSKAFIIHGFRHPLRDAFECVRKLLPDVAMTLEPGTRSGFSASAGPIVDGTPATEELGFTAETDIDEGMKRNINLLRREAGLPQVG